MPKKKKLKVELEKDEEGRYFSMKELVGFLPEPLPQSYAGVKAFIFKHKDELVLKEKFNSTDKWKRYMIGENSLKKLIKKVLS